MTELDLLRILLLASMLVGPFATRYFSAPSRVFAVAYGGALLCAAIGLFSSVSILCVAWLVFTAASFALFLRSRASSLFSPGVLAACVPFLFSNIAAVWIVGGSNNLHILGYGIEFSYYAALHGNVLGWILLGALAILANHPNRERWIHLGAMFIGFGSFLLLAVGIDQLRALKPLGIAGLSVALPSSQLVFLRGVWSRNRWAFAAGGVSFAVLVLTMVLAWRNEVVTPVFVGVLGIRGMVSVHGVLNTVIVAPLFLLAVWLDVRRPLR